MAQVAITGAGGRMGRALIEATLDTEGAHLIGATVREGSSLAGVDAAELVGRPRSGAPVVTDLEALDGANVLIDFTTIESTLANLAHCVEHGMPCVIGTTGFSADEEGAIEEAARHIPIVYAPNFSVGVNVVLDLLDRTARVLGDTVDVEVLETHHRHKVDAPSGRHLPWVGQLHMLSTGRWMMWRCLVAKARPVRVPGIKSALQPCVPVMWSVNTPCCSPLRVSGLK